MPHSVPPVPLTSPLPASLTHLLRHDAAPSLLCHALRRVFSLASLSDAASLPTFCDTLPPFSLVRLFTLLFSFAADHFSSLSKYMGPPLSLANTRVGYPSFFMRAAAPSSAHKREARAGSFFLSFSFHLLTAAPSCPPPSVMYRAVPSSHVAPVALKHSLPTIHRKRKRQERLGSLTKRYWSADKAQ